MAKPFSAMPAVMAERSRAVSAATDFLVRRAASVVHDSLVRDTRVDTGLARSNWVVRLNAPFSGVIAPYRPGVKLGMGERGNAFAAIRQGSSVIKRYSNTTSTGIYITNNVDHIGILNDKDGQFVQRSLLKGRAAITNQKLLVRRRRK